MLSIVTAMLLGQVLMPNPQGVPQRERADFPDAGLFPQHMFYDKTNRCLSVSTSGPRWTECLAEVPATGQGQKVPSFASPPAGPAAGSATYYDTTAGCLRSWTGSAWTSCPPTSQPQPPNTLLNPSMSPPVTSTVGATFYDTANGCLRTWNGTSYNMCAGPSPMVPQVLMSPAATPPSTTVVGATFYDTSMMCLRTWNGSAYTTCASQPMPPNTMLAPSASTPAISPPAGTAYYNTSCKRILTYDGSAWEACPSSAATVMSQSSSAPPLPAGAANANKGNVYFDTTLGCTRSTRDGLTWGDCLTTERCQDFAVSGVSIPLAGLTATTTIAFDKAPVGASCEILYPSFMPLNAAGVCRVSAANQIQYRFQSNTGLLSSVIAVPNGTYRACVQVIW